MKLNKNGRVSKGKRAKAQYKRELALNRENNIIKSFSKLNDKSANNRAMYKIAGLAKQHVIKTNEAKSINCPKNRFTVATKKESRADYKIDSENWKIQEKPKEWVRLNNNDLNAVKILTKTKHL